MVIFDWHCFHQILWDLVHERLFYFEEQGDKFLLLQDSISRILATRNYSKAMLVGYFVRREWDEVFDRINLGLGGISCRKVINFPDSTEE